MYAKVLKETFGFDTFRDKQLEIIEAILSGKDVSATMFTSAGKSLCYQYPAVYSGKVVIVISPLISLMDDQKMKMEEIKVPTTCLNGNVLNKNKIKKDILNNKFRLVYSTPEYIITCEEFIKELIEAELLVCVVIDESHCVSSWGKDFRESYRDLCKLKEWIGPYNVPIMALTATATETVKKDIIKTLKLVDPLIVTTSFDRPNLYIEVKPKNDIKLDIVPLLKKNESTIIYCPTRKDTEAICEILKNNNILCDAYHAGMSSMEREMVHEDFVGNVINCVVATVAFGMGIDKVIRRVIHYGIPKDIESYYQEIGRAGRDRKKSICTLFYKMSDLNSGDYFVNQISDPVYRKHKFDLLNVMKKYVRINTCRRQYIMNYFGEQSEDKCKNCDNCVHPKIILQKDITKEACMLLRIVNDTGNKFGIGTVILVLKGSNAKKVPLSCKKMKFYGCGKQYSDNWWKGLSKILLDSGLLAEKPFNGGHGFMVQITGKGKNFIKSVSNNGGITLLDDHTPFIVDIPNDMA
jgi:Werner syndrome ATP-dependent helicase